MDELEKKLVELVSRGSNALKEYQYMKENDTGDLSEVKNQIWEIKRYMAEIRVIFEEGDVEVDD